jgi:alkylation response protein AidB-like acyl-CoA dehydrogenase
MAQTTAAEREQFRASLRLFFGEHSPQSEVRRLTEDPAGYDPSVWRRLSEQLGLPAILVPEEYGGQGLSLVEFAVVLEEAGRALLCAPLFSSAGLATTALLSAAPGDEAGALLADLAVGHVIAALGVEDEPGRMVGATQGSGGWSLSGVKTRVLDGLAADVLLVTAGTSSGTGLFAVRMPAPGVSRQDLAVLDLTRRQVLVSLDQTPATMLDPDYGRSLPTTLDTAAVLASAELLGVAQRSLDIAVEYALSRRQFGALIGSFQAIKHTLADSLASVEQMRAAVATAASAAADGGTQSAQLSEIVSVTKAYCSQAAPKVVETLIQVLGGIGYTWEHPAHLYLRRARTLAMMFGSPADHRRRLATLLGLDSVSELSSLSASPAAREEHLAAGPVQDQPVSNQLGKRLG